MIEALSRGKPIIATKCGGPESIVEKKNGVLLNPKDIEGLGKAMEEVMNDIDKFDRNVIRQNCIEQFGEKSFISHMSSIFKNIINGPN